MAPIEISFQPEFIDESSYVGANAVVDSLFFLDIVINFRTTFHNIHTGDEVTNTK